jgi:hypothetical protein
MLSSGLWITLLILHGVGAFLLLGALTHQTISVWVPIHVHVSSFFDRTRAVSAKNYSVAIIWFYIATFVLGMIIYPEFKLTANNILVAQHWEKSLASFEFKEHVAAFGLALLPAYYYYWRPPLAKERDFVRAMLTSVLTFISWAGFIVGHVLNNIAGLGVAI